MSQPHRTAPRFRRACRADPLAGDCIRPARPARARSGAHGRPERARAAHHQHEPGGRV